MSAEWIEWTGGACPVEPDTMVFVRFRGATPTEPAPARHYRWPWIPPEETVPSGDFFDIVAYRLPSPPSSDKVE